MKALNFTLALYALSLATSMGGMELFSALLVAGVLALWLTKKMDPTPVTRVPFFWGFAIFTLVAVAAILLGEADGAQKIYDLGRMRFFLFYFFIFWTLERQRPLTQNWLRPLMVICLIIGIYGLVQHWIPLDLLRPEGKKAIFYALPEQKIGPLVVGAFNHHLTFANVYLFYVSLFLALGTFPKWDWKRLLLAALLAVDCLWTSSRAAWAAIPVVLALVLIRKNVKVALAALIALAIAGGIAFQFDPVLRGKWDRTFSVKEEDNLTPRSRLWQLQLILFKEHPLLGVGWNNNERKCHEYFARYFPDARYSFCGHAHSNLLQILATTGLLGLCAFLFLWGQVFVKLGRACRVLARDSLEGALAWGCFCALVGFHLQGLTQWNFGDAEVLHNLMFVLALSSVLIQRAELA